MDTITKIKNRLNIDQRNLSSGRVISISNSTARVRLPDGTEKIAYLGNSSVSSGELVQVAISGRTATIQGSATLQQNAAEKTVVI